MFAARNMMFASAAFSPLSLSPALWLDASDASTLYSGASLAAADGAISEWRDKSGNARHASQATGVSQPLRKTAIQNSRDVVRFDGANDTVEGVLANFSAITVFAAFKTLGLGVGFDRIFTQRGNGSSADFDQTGNYIPLLRSGSSTTFGSFAGGVVSSATLAENTPHLVCSIHSGTLISNYMDGSTNTPYAATLGDNGSAYGVAGMGVYGAANADIFEILVFPAALSDADRIACENYLNAKWAIY